MYKNVAVFLVVIAVIFVPVSIYVLMTNAIPTDTPEATEEVVVALEEVPTLEEEPVPVVEEEEETPTVVSPLDSIAGESVEEGVRFEGSLGIVFRYPAEWAGVQELASEETDGVRIGIYPDTIPAQDYSAVIEYRADVLTAVVANYPYSLGDGPVMGIVGNYTWAIYGEETAMTAFVEFGEGTLVVSGPQALITPVMETLE